MGEKAARSTFGDALRRERELRRVPLRDVAESTKINIRYLEALERNDFTYLPAGAFTRGFIRAYARFIGTDETEMINAYLDELRFQNLPAAAPGEEDLPPRPLVFNRPAAEAPEAPARAPRRRARLLLLALLVLLAAAAAAGLRYVLGLGSP